MRKSLIGVTCLFILMAPLSMLHAEETGAGCGVGKVVMEGKSGKDAVTSAAAINWIINMVFPHQLFGMTTGTLGCDTTQTVSNEHQKETFLAENSDDLWIDIAQGGGAHLQSFASVIGIPNEQHSAFFNLLQQNYDSITAEADMLAGIDATLLADPRFVTYVQ